MVRFIRMLWIKSGVSKWFPNQKMILKVFAIKRARQTNMENPCVVCLDWICKYCGMYGITPPNTIASSLPMVSP